MKLYRKLIPFLFMGCALACTKEPVVPETPDKPEPEIPETPENPDPEVTCEFDGKGTETDPFQIGTSAELLKLMEVVNDGELIPSDSDQKKYADAFYLQTADITLTNSEETVEKVCIGTLENPFTGVYDGGTHKLTGTDGIEEKGLSIQASTENMGNVALFGVVDGAILKNIRLVANNQNKTNTTLSAAGICALSKGETLIENSECRVQNITCCGAYIGGICGVVEDGKLEITGCKVAAMDKSGVKGNDSSNEYIGGLLGFVKNGASARIVDCYNTASIVQTPDEEDFMGGICGGNAGALVLERCYCTSQFKYGDTVTDPTEAKALSGTLVGGGDVLEGVTLTDCWYEPGNKKTKARFVQGEKFSEKKWPEWDLANTAWKDLGAFSADAPVYPSLDWE